MADDGRVGRSSALRYPWFPTVRIVEPGRHVIPVGTVIGSVREVVNWRGAPATVETDADPETKTRQTRLAQVRADLLKSGEPGNLQWRQIAKRRTSLQRLGPWRDILTAARWLSPDVCGKLVDAFTPSDAEWLEGVDLWWPDFDAWPAVMDALDDIGDALETVTHLPVEISNPHVVKWSPGKSMPVHIDVGGTNEYPNRRWASVIYLVTLDGGETIFPDRDTTIRPECGKMAAWPGGHTPHGCRTCGSGPLHADLLVGTKMRLVSLEI